MKKFNDILVENPIIAAIRNDEDLQAAIESDTQIVFVLYGSITTIQDVAQKLKESGKIFLIHLDMIDGLKNDDAGILFIKKVADPYGIITTRHGHIKYAKSLSLITILRLFIIDSKSLNTGGQNVRDIRPDAVEVMPGVSSKVIKKSVKVMKVPVIAGGLIESKEEVYSSLKAGAIAISTTKREIWDI